MISQREVIRKYERMLKDHTEPIGEKKFNNYICKVCKAVTKTVDLDRGTTPFIINCPKCRNEAKSTFYNDKFPKRLPDYGWYRPTLKETMKYRKKNKLGALDHILKGGLMIKEIEAKKVIDKKDTFIHRMPTINAFKVVKDE